MNRHTLVWPGIYDHLRKLEIEPYAKLNDTVRDQLCEGIRVITLFNGEGLTTPKPGLRITVLSGITRLEPAGTLLNLENTRDHSVLTQPGGVRLVAEEDAVVVLADADFLDNLASWSELAAFAHHSGGDTLVERFLAVKDSLAFRRLPLEHVVEALQLMTPKQVKAGDVIVSQGERGDAFYLIWSGHADVWKTGLYDAEPQHVDTLGPGDAFGDEALVTGGTRSATVKMIADGKLLVLGEQAFRDLMSSPLIEEVAPQRAAQMLTGEWSALDVRYEEEFEDGHIADAILLPLPELRQRADELLNKQAKYIAVCRSGKRSAVAAFLLKQRGYDIVSLQGGMANWEGDVVT